MREKYSANYLATAHHKDDKVETLLFRLLSGRLASDSRTITEIDREKFLLRPLLGFNKADLQTYKVERKLECVFDETNTDNNFTRNKIRNQLIPQLKTEFNPNLSVVLGEISNKLSQDEQFIEKEIQILIKNYDSFLPSDILKLHPALRWRTLKAEAIRQLGQKARRLGYRSLYELQKHLQTIQGEEKIIELGHKSAASIQRNQTIRFFLL